MILPPVALINVTPGYTIACLEFILVGHPITSNISSLVILLNNSLVTNNISDVNVHRYLIENTTWLKMKPVEQETNAIMSLIPLSIIVPTIQTPHPIHIWSLGILVFSWILFGLTASLIYYVLRLQRRNSLQNL